MTDIIRTAKLSECGRYRYSLGRAWKPNMGAALFVCLNPSTADHTKDDPTVRKCIGFAERWGFGAMWIVNLFAFRATDPRELRRAQSLGADIVGGIKNREAIIEGAKFSDRVVLAWGAHAKPWTPYTKTVTQIVQEAIGVRPLWCLGTTNDGQPRHPLMLAYKTTLQDLKDIL